MKTLFGQTINLLILTFLGILFLGFDHYQNTNEPIEKTFKAEIFQVRVSDNKIIINGKKLTQIKEIKIKIDSRFEKLDILHIDEEQIELKVQSLTKVESNKVYIMSFQTKGQLKKRKAVTLSMNSPIKFLNKKDLQELSLSWNPTMGWVNQRSIATH